MSVVDFHSFGLAAGLQHGLHQKRKDNAQRLPHFKQNTEEIREIVYGNANSFGGSFAAEHGVGQIKKKQMLNYKDEVELQLMKDLKNFLDPKNILNPGKIF